MTKTDLVQRRELARFAADLFQGTAEAMTHASEPSEKFFAVAHSLQDLRPRLTSIEPAATAGITDRAAQGAHAIGSALAAMAYEGSREQRIVAILDLADGFDGFGGALLSGANSVSARGGPDKSPDRRLVETHARTATLATTYQLKADHLRSSLGLGFLSRRSFALPALDQCSCQDAGGRAPAAVSLSAADARRSAAVLTIDEAELHFALADLGALCDQTTSFFRDLGLLFVSLPLALLAPCPNRCAPANTVSAGPLLVNATAVPNAACTLWIPTFDVRWTLCCPCTCCVFLTQNRFVRVFSTHTVAGPPNILIARPIGAAIARAQAVGGAEVAGFGAPGFVPNPAVLPPLVSPFPAPPGAGCPAC